MRDLPDETDLTQYLLGEMSEVEKLRLEERFFTDDESFEQLMALEDELRYDYARGGLTAQQRSQFERRFLSLPGESQRVALAQAVLDTVAAANRPQEPVQIAASEPKPTFFRSLLILFSVQSSALQFGLAAASILLLLGGSWLLYQTVRLRSQVEQLEVARNNQAQQQAQQTQQAGEQRARADQLSEQLEAERQKHAELEQELARQKAQSPRETSNPSPAPATMLSFLITPGLSRDIDSTKRLTIPSGVTQLRLQLKLKRPGTYQSYQAVLQMVDGAQLWQRTLPGSTGQAVTVTLPAKLVPPGDYLFVLKGKAGAGQWEEVDEYHFNIVRP